MSELPFIVKEKKAFPALKGWLKKIQKESQGQKIKFMDYDLDAAIQITELHIRTHKARVKEFNDFINKS